MIYSTYRAVVETQKSQVIEEYYPPLETWFEIHVYPRSGGGVSVYFKDITDQKQKEAKLWQTAHYDHLTGLPNRLYLYEEVKPKIKEGQSTALFFIDLNDFKMINDVCGHDTGDELLKDVANRLQSLLPSTFFVSRFGGDEFVILVPYLDDEQLEMDAERIAHVFHDPFWIQEINRFTVNVAIGISVFSKDGHDADELITKSDMAMYAAKKMKNTNWVYYQEAMSTEWNRRLRLEKDLLQAMQRDELMPYFQPEIDTVIQGVLSMELLARWEHPELGFISPLEFIPIAEDSGQLKELMQGLIRKAVQELVSWQEKVQYQGMLSVNVTSQLISEDSFCENLLRLKEEFHLADGILELELTENMQLFETPLIQQKLRILQENGIRIAIDDFGSGYSNFSYISDFPIDKIKIDKSFTDYIEVSKRGEAVLDSLILLSLRLGIDLVAEGVETEAQVSYLQKRECMFMQGYYFARPMPAREAGDYLESLFKN
ncbi:putative bifunctional diguanylate cyclase/phosphodiesterase [Chryseomicrobium palamuruense]|uniref:Bifunctional diguanylate cyclase/phosphodiesterase n=1 Tax=Chryseomicrobium palamuruense TaxID=682973 RepID=A0ABV8US40_9BACL